MTHLKIRSLLKKLRLNKDWMKKMYITNILNGIKPPTMKPRIRGISSNHVQRYTKTFR